MEALREYVIHVSATAMICAVLLRFTYCSGTVKVLIRLLCCVVLAYSVIQPLKQLDIPDLGNVIQEYRQDADHAVQQGRESATNALIESISSGTEAYILEKSKELNLDLMVEVELSDDEIPIPVAVSLTGNVAPYAKTILSKAISNDLNIPKERQTWISR